MELLDKIAGTYKIKYELLDEWIKKYFSYGNSINIYVDLNSLIWNYYRGNFIQQYNTVGAKELYKELVLNLFIIAGHYRHYFYSRYKVTSKIYFYYSFERPDNLIQIDPAYNISFFNKLLNPDYKSLTNYIKDEIKFMNKIIQNFQDIYLINTEDVDLELFPMYNIRKNTSVKNTASLILTSNIKTLQLLSYDNTFMVYMGVNKKFTTNGTELDSQENIKSNIYEFLCEKHKTKHVVSDKMTVDMLPILFALTGLSKLDIFPVDNIGFVKGLKMIENIIEKNNAKEISTILYYLKESLNDEVKSNRLENNLKLINLSIEYEKLSKADLIRFSDQIIDKYDINTVELLNNEYFENKLPLKELSEGCSITIRDNNKRRILI